MRSFRYFVITDVPDNGGIGGNYNSWYYGCESFYDNFVTYVDKNFGFSKTTAFNLVGCAVRYGERDEAGRLSGKLAEAYKDYNCSQLVEMLSLPELLRSDLTIKQIRDYKKVLFEKEKSKKLLPTSGVTSIQLPGQTVINIKSEQESKPEAEASVLCGSTPSAELALKAENELLNCRLSHFRNITDIPGELTKADLRGLSHTALYYSLLDIQKGESVVKVFKHLHDEKNTPGFMRKYSDTDFIGLHKPALIQIILDLIDGVQPAKAIAAARNQVD